MIPKSDEWQFCDKIVNRPGFPQDLADTKSALKKFQGGDSIFCHPAKCGSTFGKKTLFAKATISRATI
jgi:hypothetical protein